MKNAPKLVGVTVFTLKFGKNEKKQNLDPLSVMYVMAAGNTYDFSNNTHGGKIMYYCGLCKKNHTHKDKEFKEHMRFWK